MTDRGQAAEASRGRSILLMLGASLAFAAMAAGAKHCARRVPVAEIVFVRSVLSGVLLAVPMIRGRVSCVGRQPWVLLSRAGVGFTAMMLYFWCLSQIDLGTAVMLNYTAPIVAVGLAHVFFRERSDRWFKALLTASFVGVALLAAPQWELKPWALGAGLLSGVLAGAVHLIIRFTHRDEDPLTIVFYFTWFSAAGSLGLMGFETWVVPTSAEWFVLGVVTVGAFAGQIALTHSLRGAPVSVVSPFGYFTPVFGLLLGALLWGEIPSPMALTGGAIIILCGVLLYGRQTRLSSALSDS